MVANAFLPRVVPPLTCVPLLSLLPVHRLNLTWCRMRVPLAGGETVISLTSPLHLY